MKQVTGLLSSMGSTSSISAPGGTSAKGTRTRERVKRGCLVAGGQVVGQRAERGDPGRRVKAQPDSLRAADSEPTRDLGPRNHSGGLIPWEHHTVLCDRGPRGKARSTGGWGGKHTSDTRPA